jgi:hypothetical protein
MMQMRRGFQTTSRQAQKRKQLLPTEAYKPERWADTSSQAHPVKLLCSQFFWKFQDRNFPSADERFRTIRFPWESFYRPVHPDRMAEQTGRESEAENPRNGEPVSL